MNYVHNNKKNFADVEHVNYTWTNESAYTKTKQLFMHNLPSSPTHAYTDYGWSLFETDRVMGVMGE